MSAASSTTRPTGGPRRRRRRMKLEQLAAIGSKRAAPTAHRGNWEFRQWARQNLATVVAELEDYQARVSAASSLVPTADPLARTNTGRLPEENAMAYLSDPRAYLSAKPLKPLWADQLRLCEVAAELEETPRYGSRGMILNWTTGGGKTAGLLAFIHSDAVARHHAGLGRFGYPTLIVAPKGIYQQWTDEARKFYTDDMLAFDALDSSGDTRALRPQRVMECLDFVVVSYDTLKGAHRQRESQGRTLFDIPWYRIIVDEGTHIVNEETQVFEACAEIAADRRIFVTATPVPNGRASEINAILSFLKSTIKLPSIPTIETLTADEALEGEASTLAPPTDIGQTFEWRAWVETLATYCVFVRPPADESDEALGATRTTKQPTQIIYVTLSDEERRLYERVEREAKRTQEHQLATMTKLRQLCISPVLILSDEERAQLPANRPPSTKIRTILEIEAAMGRGEKGLVICETQAPLDELGHHLTQRGISWAIIRGDMTPAQRRAVVQRVADHTSPHPRLTFLLLRLGEGIDGLQGTLEHGGGANHVIHLDGHWTPSTEFQSNGRADRYGQTRPVYCYKPVAYRTIEDRVLARNEMKRDLNARLFREAELRFWARQTEAD